MVVFGFGSNCTCVTDLEDSVSRLRHAASNAEDVTNQCDSSIITVCNDSRPSDGRRSRSTAAVEARDRLKAMTLRDEDELELC